MFLRNAWYPIAWEREIDVRPHAAMVLGERVVVYRADTGDYAALDDACPHRKLPLSMGRVIGEYLECGYHGLTFAPGGGCVKSPTNGTVPPGLGVRSYPVEARYGLVWIWMGEVALADPATIFTVEQWDNPGWGTTVGDDMIVECDYRLIIDNLLDPSHVAWVHVGSFAGDGSDQVPLETTIADDGVTTWRWLLDTEPAPFYAPYLEFSGRCDRKQQYEVRYPSHALIRAFFCPAGTGGEGAARHPATFQMDSYNFLTPIDERTTRYFWFQQRNVAPADADVSRRFAASVRAAFEEDQRILGAVQRGLERAGGSALNLRSDAGGIRFRRRLDHLIAGAVTGETAVATTGEIDVASTSEAC